MWRRNKFPNQIKSLAVGEGKTGQTRDNAKRGETLLFIKEDNIF